AGQARPAAEADRALLRGLPDHQKRPESFGVDEAGIVRLLHPPLEGEGRLALSAAKCETGWGDLSTPTLLDVERPSPHPAAHCMSVDPPPPGQGNRMSDSASGCQI